MHTYHEPNNVNHTLKVYNIFMWIFSMASLFFNVEGIRDINSPVVYEGYTVCATCMFGAVCLLFIYPLA